MCNIITNLLREFSGQKNLYRHENKYLIPLYKYNDIVLKIKRHPAVFREIYETRTINNIYLDTPDFKFYSDNVSGSANRVKARIRWYGNLLGYVSNSHLEFKIKTGLLGNKYRFNLPTFNLNDSFNIDTLRMLLNHVVLPVYIKEYIKLLSPTLVNSYERTYFINYENNYRITVDRNIKYYKFLYKPYVLNCDTYNTNNSIIELKYDKNFEANAYNISNHLGLRITKMSKYSTGIDCIYSYLSR